MRNFSIHNPTRLHFGHGQLARLAEEIPPGSRVLALHGGADILRNGLWAEVERNLRHCLLNRFAGIETCPQYDTLLRALSLARHERCDFILAVGGDGPIDAGKFLAAALCHAGEPLQLLTGMPIRAALPLGCVLTLPFGRALQRANGLVSHVEWQRKLPFASPLLHPRFAILDPASRANASQRQLAHALIEAFVRTLERYLTRQSDAPLQDRYAEGLLLTLIEQGLALTASPGDSAVHANLLWCALQALDGAYGCGVPRDRSARLIGQQLSALYHLAPAQALAVLLPAQLAEQREAKGAKLTQYAERVWQLHQGDRRQRIDDAIAATTALFRRLGLATRLTEHGLDAEAVPEVLAQLQRQALATPGLWGELDLADCERILLRAL
ncbi:iron-containing alcohol dehydrogenase [Pseudomonas sp. SP16.1]|uniref:iron-containing alcohol dehydrogenase n=1 Tax=Pseudomonas sp. SP16.1 TaxID=3458854 RepID=UPI0040465BD2